MGKNLTATTKASSEQKRQQASSAIYPQFGETTVYKQDNGSFKMYQPNSEDELAFEQSNSYQEKVLQQWQQDQKLGGALHHQVMVKFLGSMLAFLTGLVYWWRRFYPRIN